MIPRFIKALLQGKQPVIYGDGTQSRDFTYIQNVVEANILASTAKMTTESAPGNVFNIACGERITLIRLVQQLNELLGTAIQPFHDKPRPGDIKHSQADITLAKKMLGFKPAVSFEEGLQKTIEWFRQH